MRQEAIKDDARNVLLACGAYKGQDFDTLRSSQVEKLLEYADAREYRAPKNANGSRGRYFYNFIQRRAA